MPLKSEWLKPYTTKLKLNRALLRDPKQAAKDAALIVKRVTTDLRAAICGPLPKLNRPCTNADEFRAHAANHAAVLTALTPGVLALARRARWVMVGRKKRTK